MLARLWSYTVVEEESVRRKSSLHVSTRISPVLDTIHLFIYLYIYMYMLGSYVCLYLAITLSIHAFMYMHLYRRMRVFTDERERPPSMFVVLG